MAHSNHSRSISYLLYIWGNLFFADLTPLTHRKRLVLASLGTATPFIKILIHDHHWSLTFLIQVLELRPQIFVFPPLIDLQSVDQGLVRDASFLLNYDYNALIFSLLHN